MPKQRRYYVYLLASKSRVLYVGVTGALMVRVLRHKAGRAGISRGSIASAGWFGIRVLNS
jgi:predicted GIY-YIG superfamily endonuclease